MIDNSPIKINLENYNDKMSLAQVITFFERQGVVFKSTTIQNYVRVGVIPPVQNRNYTKNHIIYLALIYHLKHVFSLEEIKKIFDTIDLKNHPQLLTTIYKEYVNLDKETISKFLHFIKEIYESTEKSSKKNELSSDEQHNLQLFLNSLLVCSIGVFIKKFDFWHNNLQA